MQPGIAILPEREGEGFHLRCWTLDDAEVLTRAVAQSARHLRPWMAWVALEPLTVERRREWLIQRQREWSGGGDVVHGVFVGHKVAGGCGLHRRRGPQTLEIGYWIHPSFTRRGLATEVAPALTDAAFTVSGIAQVEIHHDKANIASSGVPRRLGFEFVGETPDEPTAPAEIGIDCAWRVDRNQWRHGRVSGEESPSAAPGIVPRHAEPPAVHRQP